MKKIFNKFFIRSLIVLSLMIVSVNICSAAVTVTVTADSTTVPYGGQTTIRWSSTGAVNCTLPDAYGGWTAQTYGYFITNPLYSTTSFSITCAGYAAPNPNYYFKLAHCTSSNVFQTGPFPSGTYGTGEVLAGALDNGAYDYRVVDSSPTPFPGLTNIMTSRTGGYACRPIH